MKSLLIVLLGTLPLAILTAKSLVELWSIEDASPARGIALDPPADAAPAPEDPSKLKTDKLVAEGLGEVDLLASETVPGLKELAAGASFDPLKEAWTRWVNVRQLVGRSAGVPLIGETAGPDQLQDMVRKLEPLQAEYEKSRPEGGEAIVSLLGRRIESLKRRVAQAAIDREADFALAQARAEFLPQRFGRCVTLCDQWLAKYAGLDPSVTAKMRILRDRAQFFDAHEQMLARFRAADSLVSQMGIVEGFVTRYSDRPSPTAREREILEQCQGALARLQARLQAEALSRQAAEALRSLAQKPPSDLAQRLQAAAEIRRDYPTAAVSQAIRKEIHSWLAELLAEKQFEEPAGLLEAETRQGQILRGFFRKSTASDGSLIGYQHFTDYQQYRDAAAQVGTYAKGDLLGAPGDSLPRQCVGQYRLLRDELLSQPGRKTNWENLAAACDQLDAKLAEYRKKPGSGSVPLSFQAEARLVREVLSGPLWGSLERLLGE